MFEIDVDQGYRECSPGQIQLIEARYHKASCIAQERLSGKDFLWLDIGPNRGFGLKQLKLIDRQIIAVDIEHKYLNEALTNNPYVRGAVMDGKHLGFRDGLFGVVSLFEVIEHMGESEQRELLREIRRVLQPESLFILSTPNKIASGRRRMSKDHAREVSFEELASLLIEEGFEILEHFGQSFFNNSLSHRVFRLARENPVMVFLYYRALPWFLRNRFKDISLTSQQSDQIRSPAGNEIERGMFIVCRKIA